jgi:hypothetical protein
VSWFWLLFFLVLSGMAVGVPLFLSSPASPGPGAPEPPGPEAADEPRRRRLEEALVELDLDLGAGKVTAEEHAAARAALLAEPAVVEGAGAIPPPVVPPPEEPGA